MRRKFWSYLRTMIFYKLLRLKTFGVRVAVFHQGQVLLIKDRWSRLWVFPGGGIQTGESIKDAAVREFGEETGLAMTGKTISELKQFGEFKNISFGKNDHVYLFCADVPDVSELSPLLKKSPLNFLEVADLRWFPINDLPKTISDSTRQRIFEMKKGHPISQIW